MKKVLFVASVTSHINSFHIPYLKWFKEQGYEVHVASNGNEKIEYCDKHFDIPFERFPIKVNNLRAYKQLKNVIDENKYTIIHCHTPVGGVLTRLAARDSRKKNNTKVMYTAHGFHFYKGAPILNWIIYYPIEKICARWTDCLITINEEDYNLAKNKFNVKQIELVHGVGVDKDKFDFEFSNEEKSNLRNGIGLKCNEFVIIYPAELSKRKNQGMLLETMKMLKKDGYNNIKLLLPGKDSMNGKYQQMAKKMKIKENVKFLGYRKDIPKLMRISDLAVSTAKQEGLPVNIMEAMMCELPIIATDCRGNRDLIGDTISLKKGSIELERRIIKQINSSKEKVQYKKMEKYLLENVIQEMERIYERK